VFRRRSEKHPEDELFPGLLLLRMEGRLFFGNTERVLDLIAPLVEAARPRVVAARLSAAGSAPSGCSTNLTHAVGHFQSRQAT
jgi:hypothetical protein